MTKIVKKINHDSMWIKVVFGVGQFAKLVINRRGVNVQFKGDTWETAQTITTLFSKTKGTYGERVEALDTLLTREFIGVI